MSITPDARSGEDDDQLLKRRLERSLTRVNHDGTFSSKLSYTEYANPGLHITGLGSVGLPLSSRDAEAIKKLAKQSPFGRGSETVVDTSVRKTWELDQHQFGTHNPSWRTFLNGVAKRSVDNLGVRIQISAQRYKLLLYEEGAFFKAHTDSEKAPGMFGTLVICLPSEHTGGDVRLVHGRKERVLNPAHGSEFDLSALAWYSDVQHEVQPVTSGHRLVLTYNLIQDQQLPRQAAATLDKHHRKFGSLLRYWTTDLYYLEKFVYPLEHRYSKASLSLQNLKGRDAAKGHFLNQTCSKNGAYWFLGTMTKRESKDDDYADEEETGVYLDYLMTPSGVRIDALDSITVHEEEEMLVDGYYYDRTPDSEDEAEYTGNVAVGAAYRYHDTVLVMIPKETLLDQCPSRNLRGPEALRPIFELLRNDPVTSPKYETLCMSKILIKILGALGDYRGTSHTKVSYHGIGGASGEAQSWLSLYEEICRFCHAAGRADAIGGALGAITQTQQWWSSTYIMDIIGEQAVKDGNAGIDTPWAKWFRNGSDPPSFKRLDDRFAALTAFASKAAFFPTPLKESFFRWKKTHLRNMVLTITTYDPKDMKHLLNIVGSSLMAGSDSERDFYFSHLVSILLKGTSRDSLLDLVRNLIRQSEKPSSPWNSFLKATLRGLVNLDVSLFKISTSDFGYKTITQQQTQGWRTVAGPAQRVPVSPLWFVDVLKELVSKSLDKEAIQFVTLGLPKLPSAQDPFWKLWKPVLDFTDNLVTQLSRCRTLEVGLMASTFVYDVLHHCIIHLVDTRPVKPRDWSRPFSAVCGCQPCNRLRLFTRHPHQEVGRFSYNEQIRRHLRGGLLGKDYLCETDKSSGSPHTLVVKKTTAQYDELKRSWKKDVGLMRQHLDKMKRDHPSWTNSVLGDRFNAIRQLACTLSNSTYVPGGPTQSAPSGPTRPPGHRDPTTITLGLPHVTTQSTNSVQQTSAVPLVGSQSRPPVTSSGPSHAPKRVRTSSGAAQPFRNVRPEWNSSSSTNAPITNPAIVPPSPFAALQQPPGAPSNAAMSIASAAQPLKPLPSAAENARSALSTSVAPASVHAVPPVIGVKRKAETQFVDLTGDASE